MKQKTKTKTLSDHFKVMTEDELLKLIFSYSPDFFIKNFMGKHYTKLMHRERPEFCEKYKLLIPKIKKQNRGVKI